MVDKATTRSRTVIDLASYRERIGARAPVILTSRADNDRARHHNDAEAEGQGSASEGAGHDGQQDHQDPGHGQTPTGAALAIKQRGGSEIVVAFCSDGARPLGLYFGAESGEVFASADDGATWQIAARHLPPVVSVRDQMGRGPFELG